MFDIGFIEILLIAVVALLVLGPDKLPGAIRTTGLWIGRLKRSFNNVRSEIEREIGADEIRRQLRNEAIMDKIKNTRSQVTQRIDSVKDEVKSISDSVSIKKEMNSLNQTLNPTSSRNNSQAAEAAPDKQIASEQPQEAKPEVSVAKDSGSNPAPGSSEQPATTDSNPTDPDDKQRT